MELEKGKDTVLALTIVLMSSAEVSLGRVLARIADLRFARQRQYSIPARFTKDRRHVHK